VKKKIVYLFTSCKNRGPTKQTLNIIKYLDGNKFCPILVTLYKDSPDDSILNEFTLFVEKHYTIDSSPKKILLGSNKAIFNLLEEIGADIIHSIGLIPAIVAQRYAKSIHFTTIRNFVRDDYITKFGQITGSIMAKMHLSVIKKCNNVYTCSESLSKLYKETFNFDLPFIRNGVDIKNYPLKIESEAEILREKFDLPQDKIIYIYTGQFVPRKDQQFAINGFLENKIKNDAILLLLGDGAIFQELYDKYNGNDVIFTGNVANVSEYLRAADVYISTSKSEGLPNGVLEAMATGLPVLLSDILQHKEIYEINDKIGLLYKLGNQNDFNLQLTAMAQQDFKRIEYASYEVISTELNAKSMSENYQREYLSV